MANKKYVDNTIVAAKKFLRADMDNLKNDLSRDLYQKIQTLNGNFAQLGNLEITLNENFNNFTNSTTDKFNQLYNVDLKTLREELLQKITDVAYTATQIAHSLKKEITDSLSVFDISATSLDDLKNEMLKIDSTIKNDKKLLMKGLFDMEEQVLKRMNDKIITLEQKVASLSKDV